MSLSFKGGGGFCSIGGGALQSCVALQTILTGGITLRRDSFVLGFSAHDLRIKLTGG